MYFLEGQIVSHVCVKGLNNNVNNFCTEVEKHMFLTVWRTSAITTQTPYSAATWLLWCSKLYITWKLWALDLWSCNQNMIFATDLCMAEVICCNSWCLSSCNFYFFSNITFHTFSQTGWQQRTQYKQRGYFQMKIFNGTCLFSPTRLKVLQHHFPFQANKNTNTNRTTL